MVAIVSKAAQKHIETLEAGDELRLRLAGDWTTFSVGQINRELDRISGTRKRIVIDMTSISALDTAGAWLVHRTRREWAKAGAEVAVDGASPAFQGLLETVASHDSVCPPAPKGHDPLSDMVVRVGAATTSAGAAARDLIAFLGLTVVATFRSLLNPRRIRFHALVTQMEQTGLNALPIVGLISFLVGVVLAYQGADQLARFGAQIFTVNLVAIGVLREMGILLTAIIVAGRSGSAFTAQIGTMKVNEEIDALRTIGLDPIDVLVMPRVLGLVLVLPLLTFYADLMGLLGGAVMASVTLDISLVQFARQLQDAVQVKDFWVGMIKAPLFAFIIALVGCYEGLQVARSAESVGRQTTRAVVESIFLVIVLDAMLSILFSVIGI
ncbi:MAG: MlaE family lipid ABC transporter permease subunit [Pseudomonadota bacterium]